MICNEPLEAWLTLTTCFCLVLACSSSRAGNEPSLSGATEVGADRTAGAALTHWTGTWATSPQLTEPQNLPPAPGLSGNTLRQIVYVSIGGNQLRVQFSNAFGTSPVTLSSARIALSTTGSTIEPSSDTALSFDGLPSVTIPAGAEVFSDPLAFALPAQTKLAVTIQFGALSNDVVTGHPGSRTTSYLQRGNAVSQATLTAASTADHWYVLTGIDVLAPLSSGAIVTLGDSITDGRGSTTNGNDRWPDVLSRRLRTSPATAGVAVLNMGVGGNSVLSGGIGPTAVQRFDRDVLAQRGARWLIVLEGVNDIGNARNLRVAAALIAAYQQLIEAAHARRMLVYGVPILPFGGSQYDTAEHEVARQTVNAWIRASGRFDAVIDLDAAVRDPASPAKLLPAYDSGDHLHLNVAGLQAMAQTVDLALFEDPARRAGAEPPR